MKSVQLHEVAPIVLNKMAHGGVFFTVKDKSGRINTMNIGWGSVANYWNGPVFVAPIRHARYTYELLKDADTFTVSVPLDDSLKHALMVVGTKHGNECDKFAEAGITTADAQSIYGAIIPECALHIECKIQLATEMDFSRMSDETRTRFYSDNDAHTLYFGEVTACYRTDLTD